MVVLVNIAKPKGHVITGDLNMIRDAKLRSLLLKGPSYREQNWIDWDVNEKLCKEAVAKYRCKWARKEKAQCSVGLSPNGLMLVVHIWNAE